MFTSLLTACGWFLGGLIGGLINLDHSFESAAL